MNPNVRLARAGYVVAFVVAILPLVDATMPFLPIHAGDPRWRLLLLGVLSNILLIPLVGLAVACYSARLSGNARSVRVVGWIAVAAAVLDALCALTFLATFAGVARTMAPQVRSTALPVATTAFVKYALAFAATFMVALASLRPRFTSAAKS